MQRDPLTWCASSFHIGNHEWIIRKWSGTNYIPPLVLINPTGRFILDDEGRQKVQTMSRGHQTRGRHFIVKDTFVPKDILISKGMFVLTGILIPKGIFGLKVDSSLKGLRNPKGIANLTAKRSQKIFLIEISLLVCFT